QATLDSKNPTGLPVGVVSLLIDEYDVPLDKALQAGYYNEMVSLIRNMFSNSLKTNVNLHFAVLTGCLRVSKESIFTGLNNLNTLSITDVHFDEYFGFTDDEVKELLAYYKLSDFYHTVKEWYDGYRFGNVAVYCPWDVINYCYTLLADPMALPEDYWSNTSSNSIVRRFVDKANKKTRDEIERLISGETIIKEIRPDLTYNEIDNTIDNLWSVLFTTGYLTQRGIDHAELLKGYCYTFQNHIQDNRRVAKE
ncbi:MAG: AAA family ATPase, partial [Lachnospiraceae bacterium]